MRRFVSGWGLWLMAAFGLLVPIATPSWLDGSQATSLPAFLLFLSAWSSCLIGAIVASVIFHESAHGLACIALRVPLMWVCIGKGRQVAEFRLRSTRLVIMSRPASGNIGPAYPPGRFPALRYFVLVAAGPVANLLLCVGAGMLAVATPSSWAVARVGADSALALLCVTNAYCAVISLCPSRFTIGGRIIPNDGMLLLQIATRRMPIEALGHSVTAYLSMQDELKKALPALRDWSACALFPWPDALNNVTATDLAAELVRWSRRPSTSKQARWLVLDGFATWVLLSGKHDLLDHAEKLINELLEQDPDSWTLHGTKGSILIEQGRLADGKLLLSGVMENDPSPFDRAISACFLALAEAKEHNFEGAHKWLAVARKTDPHTEPLRRIQGLVADYCPDVP